MFPNWQDAFFQIGVRRQQEQQDLESEEASTLGFGLQNQPAPVVVLPGLDEAKQKVCQSLIQAEQFKATVAEPKGNSLSDDDFFHLMCHVDSNLVAKIKRGTFCRFRETLAKRHICKTWRQDGMGASWKQHIFGPCK